MAAAQPGDANGAAATDSRACPLARSPCPREGDVGLGCVQKVLGTVEAESSGGLCRSGRGRRRRRRRRGPVGRLARLSRAGACGRGGSCGVSRFPVGFSCPVFLTTFGLGCRSASGPVDGAVRCCAGHPVVCGGSGVRAQERAFRPPLEWLLVVAGAALVVAVEGWFDVSASRPGSAVGCGCGAAERTCRRSGFVGGVGCGGLRVRSVFASVWDRDTTAPALRADIRCVAPNSPSRRRGRSTRTRSGGNTSCRPKGKAVNPRSYCSRTAIRPNGTS
jgi:hypothetical protein